jgi:CubicO group peptidase (beta-lactamase class C family)
VPAYHVLSYEFLLGELVQRVTGADVRDYIQAELLGPLGLRDTAHMAAVSDAVLGACG